MIAMLQESWKNVLLFEESYRLKARMEGHQGPVNCFAIIGDGNLLASGGDDEAVRIWDLVSYEQRESLVDKAGRWGQITCLQWMRLDNNNNFSASGLLCFGTGRGRVAIYKLQRKRDRFTESSDTQVFNAGDSVETMAFDAIHFRVLTTSHHGKIKMFRLEKEELSALWTIELNEAIPRSAHFVNRGEDILIFALESGEITCRDAQTASLKHSRTLKSAIGNTDMDEFEKNIVVDNISSGFDIYPIHRSTVLHSFAVPAKKKYVRMVVFGEKGTMVVGGSDHGKVYIFDTKVKEPRPVQCITHGKSTSLVQTIITTTLEDRHLIVTGSSDDKSSICVWEKPTRRALEQKRRDNERQGVVGFSAALLFFNFLLVVTSRAWFPAFKAELSTFPQMVRGAVDNVLNEPLHWLIRATAPFERTDPVQQVLLPREVLDHLPHDILMRVGEGRLLSERQLSENLKE